MLVLFSIWAKMLETWTCSTLRRVAHFKRSSAYGVREFGRNTGCEGLQDVIHMTNLCVVEVTLLPKSARHSAKNNDFPLTLVLAYNKDQPQGS